MGKEMKLILICGVVALIVVYGYNAYMNSTAPVGS